MIDNNELVISDQLDLRPGEPEPGTGVEAHERSVGSRVCERGMVTAEWAIGVVVAVSLAGLVLLFVVKGPGRELLTGIILKIINLVSGWGLTS